MQNRHLQFFAISECGLVRESNEDSYACGVNEGGISYFLIADGMGGHMHGELASQTAVRYCVSRFQEEGISGNAAERAEAELADVIQKANIKVYLKSLESDENHGMGTTLTIGLVVQDRFYLGHVGDSRCYILRGGILEQLSRDHTLVQEMQDAGQITRAESSMHPQRHILTQALGSNDYLKPEILHLDLKAHDRFLFCSDGLHGVVSEDVLTRELRRAATPEAAAQALIKQTMDAGAPDNVTVIVLFA